MEPRMSRENTAEEKKRLNSRIYNHTLANQGSRAKREVLIIIDSNSLIHRAYHALPLLTTKKGELVNAIYGFLLVFLKTLRELQPDYVVAAFDLPGATFRHEQFKEYKAKRPPVPDDLRQQIPKVKEVLKAFNAPIFEKEGFEADDIIGTISEIVSKRQTMPKIETIILSGDLDALQLINRNTKVYTLKRGLKDTVLYDERKVQERYGLLPAQLIDFKALKGDPSDNIPGVLGIGEKIAVQLIKHFGSLENLYRKIEETTREITEIKPTVKEKLKKFKEQAFFSKMLVQMRIDVPIDFDFEKCRWGEYDKEKVAQIFRELEFNSLIARLPSSGAKAAGEQEKLPNLKEINTTKKLL